MVLIFARFEKLTNNEVEYKRCSMQLQKNMKKMLWRWMELNENENRKKIAMK